MSASHPKSHLVANSSYYGLALIALAFFSFPTAWMLMSSLKAETDIAVYPPIWLFTPSLESFRHLFEEMNAWDAFLNSALIVGLATSFAMMAGTLAAYALARFDIKNKDFIAFEILSIRMLPPIVSVIPLFMIAKQLGVFDTPWLLMAVYTLNGLPFVVWIMRVFIQEIPQSIEEAALIDGCSRFECFWRVTLPLLLPGLAATMVIIFMFAWNEYLLASILTSKDARTLPVIAASAIKPKAISWGLASAAGVLMSVPVVVLVLMMQRYLVRGLTLGAVKG